MKKIFSAGLILFRVIDGERLYLLLHYPHGHWDFVKGKIEEGESKQEAALRELEEETGITADHIELDSTFRFTTCYPVRYQRHGDEEFEKTLTIFLGRLTQDVPITPTEHIAYEWFRWEPPHRIQKETIDPLLEHLMEHLNQISHHGDTEARRKSK